MDRKKCTCGCRPCLCPVVDEVCRVFELLRSDEEEKLSRELIREGFKPERVGVAKAPIKTER